MKTESALPSSARTAFRWIVGLPAVASGGATPRLAGQTLSAGKLILDPRSDGAWNAICDGMSIVNYAKTRGRDP